jgi:alcohol dehydrogenase class IV
LAGPIGGRFTAAHGAVCAALLPHVMAANLRALRDRQPTSETLRRYEQVARLLTGNASAVAETGVQWVRKLVQDLQIPPLGHYGIQREHVAELVEKAAQASSMRANPIALTGAEVADILQQAI